MKMNEATLETLKDAKSNTIMKYGYYLKKKTRQKINYAVTQDVKNEFKKIDPDENFLLPSNR